LSNDAIEPSGANAMPNSDTAEPQAVIQGGWRLLQRHSDTLEAWALEPPQLLLEKDRQIVRLLANLAIAALRDPESAAEIGQPISTGRPADGREDA
jgi:hypothetical protein